MAAEIAAANAAWASTLVAALLGEGPRDVVISPGARSTPLVLALRAHPHARLWPAVLDERAAGFFALGLARVRAQATLLICTSGSAVAHYGPAVLEAAGSEVPLILLSADRPPELHHCGAPQTLVQLGLFGSHLRFAADLGVPSGAPPTTLRLLMGQALAAAEGSPAGPVHLNLAFREPLCAAPPWPSAPPQLPPVQRVYGARQLAPTQLRDLATALSDQPRGLIVCGPMPPSAAPAPLAAAVAALAAALGWPVLAEPTSQLRYPEVLAAASIGSYDLLLRDPAFAARQATTCVLRLGAMPTSRSLTTYLQRYAQGRTFLLGAAGRWQDPTGGLASLVVADVTATCAALAAQLRPAAGAAAWTADWRRADAAAGAVIERGCTGALWEGALVQGLLRALPAGAALHVASSLAIRDLDSFGTHHPRPLAVYCSRGTNGIDGTLATALGSAAAAPLRRTYVLMGDLALLHDVGALQLARQLQVPLTALVVNNGGGAIFDGLPQAAHADAYVDYFRTPQVADLAALCAASDVPHQAVTSLAELATALAAAPPSGLQLIEARVQPHSVALRDAIWQAVAHVS